MNTLVFNTFAGPLKVVTLAKFLRLIPRELYHVPHSTGSMPINVMVQMFGGSMVRVDQFGCGPTGEDIYYATYDLSDNVNWTNRFKELVRGFTNCRPTCAMEIMERMSLQYSERWGDGDDACLIRVSPREWMVASPRSFKVHIFMSDHEDPKAVLVQLKEDSSNVFFIEK